MLAQNSTGHPAVSSAVTSPAIAPVLILLASQLNTGQSFWAHVGLICELLTPTSDATPEVLADILWVWSDASTWEHHWW